MPLLALAVIGCGGKGKCRPKACQSVERRGNRSLPKAKVLRGGFFPPPIMVRFSSPEKEFDPSKSSSILNKGSGERTPLLGERARVSSLLSQGGMGHLRLTSHTTVPWETPSVLSQLSDIQPNTGVSKLESPFLRIQERASQPWKLFILPKQRLSAMGTEGIISVHFCIRFFFKRKPVGKHVVFIWRSGWVGSVLVSFILFCFVGGCFVCTLKSIKTKKKKKSPAEDLNERASVLGRGRPIRKFCFVSFFLFSFLQIKFFFFFFYFIMFLLNYQASVCRSDMEGCGWSEAVCKKERPSLKGGDFFKKNGLQMWFGFSFLFSFALLWKIFAWFISLKEYTFCFRALVAGR
ncbi:hypothetical protein E2320_012463 [Naja naja]|nr:hypothetical protein E2320_012463 [Naja naja]